MTSCDSQTDVAECCCSLRDLVSWRQITKALKCSKQGFQKFRIFLVVTDTIKTFNTPSTEKKHKQYKLPSGLFATVTFISVYSFKKNCSEPCWDLKDCFGKIKILCSYSQWKTLWFLHVTNVDLHFRLIKARSIRLFRHVYRMKARNPNRLLVYNKLEKSGIGNVSLEKEHALAVANEDMGHTHSQLLIPCQYLNKSTNQILPPEPEASSVLEGTDSSLIFSVYTNANLLKWPYCMQPYWPSYHCTRGRLR